MQARSILCPVDFSPSSDFALAFAASLARGNNAKLHIVHVERNPIPFGPGSPGTLPSPIALGYHAISTQVPDGVDQFERQLLLGDPAAEICKYAAANDIDMIVVGSHGQTGLRRLLMGSVAEGIARNATVPVVTVSSNADKRTATTPPGKSRTVVQQDRQSATRN